MFKRRDIPPVLLLLLLIILVMLTLSQILVVHKGRYTTNAHSLRKLQMELRDMDINLHSLMMQNVPSIELNRRLLQNKINTARFAQILSEAQKPSGTAIRPWDAGSSHKNNSTPTAAVSKHKSHQKNNQTISAPEIDKSRTLFNVSTEDVIATDRANLLSPDLTHQNRPNYNMVGESTTVRNVFKYCPSVPPSLKGSAFVDVKHTHTYTEADIVLQNPDVQEGGHWKPSKCVARHKVAIILPYRDRKEHLLILLSHLHPILQRQQLDYRIYVVEQDGTDTFNKARIMNIAFVEAMKQYPFQCFVFHDVDLVPEDDRNMYSCPLQPRHMSVAIDEMGYKLAYQELVGGVLNMRSEHFQKVNGYSNLYWGWGAEDDDMAYRIMHVGLKITRPPETIARYKMIRHAKRKPSDWRKRAKLLYTVTRRFQFDGLNSLQYKLIHIEDRRLYTHILVNIGKPPKGF